MDRRHERRAARAARTQAAASRGGCGRGRTRRSARTRGRHGAPPRLGRRPSGPRRSPLRQTPSSLAGVSESSVAKSVTSTPRSMQAGGDQPGDALPRSVVARRRPPRDRAEDGDLHLVDGRARRARLRAPRRTMPSRGRSTCPRRRSRGADRRSLVVDQPAREERVRHVALTLVRLARREHPVGGSAKHARRLLEVEQRETDPVDRAGDRLLDAVVDEQPAVLGLEQRRADPDAQRVPPGAARAAASRPPARSSCAGRLSARARCPARAVAKPDVGRWKRIHLPPTRSGSSAAFLSSGETTIPSRSTERKSSVVARKTAGPAGP